jgi:hypothetical protein
MYYLFFILLLPFQVHADCLINNGKEKVRIPETKKASLFDPGKSLSTHAIQDQDGLGTCYANATTAVLKSVLPSNPDISYAHAAIQSATRGWRSDWSKGNQKYLLENESGKTRSVIEGGFICETIAALKKGGGACPKKYSLSEGLEQDDIVLQKSIFKNLGKYFDHLDQLSKDPVALKEFQEDLLLTADLLKKAQREALSACEEDQEQEFPVRSGLTISLNGLALSLEKEDSCEEAYKKHLKSVIETESTWEKDRARLYPGKDLLARVKALVQNPTKKDALNKALDSDLDEEGLRSLGTAIFEEIMKGAPTEEFTKACAQKGKEDLALDPVLIAKDFVFGINLRKKESCASSVYDIDLISKVKVDELNKCIAPTNFDTILYALAPLLDAGHGIDQQLLEKFSTPQGRLGLELKKIIAPECEDKKNLIDLSGVSCASFSMCKDPIFDPNMLNNNYDGKQDCYGIEKARDIFQMNVIPGVNSGRALGIDVCTAFMKDLSILDSDYCRNENQAGVDGHGYHAMAISGYRCVDGRIEYEVLNSWGVEGSCPASHLPYVKSPGIECDRDRDGNLTGRFWVKEDVLIKSTLEIIQVRNKK